MVADDGMSVTEDCAAAGGCGCCGTEVAVQLSLRPGDAPPAVLPVPPPPASAATGCGPVEDEVAAAAVIDWAVCGGEAVRREPPPSASVAAAARSADSGDVGNREAAVLCPAQGDSGTAGRSPRRRNMVSTSSSMIWRDACVSSSAARHADI